MNTFGQPSPNSYEAEKALIGAILIKPTTIDLITSEIDPADFYWPELKAVYEAMLRLQSKSVPIDPATVVNELPGSIVLVAEIAMNSIGSTNILAYAGIIKEKSVLRKIVSAANEMISQCNQEDTSSQDIISAAESIMFSLGAKATKTEAEKLDPIMLRTIARIDEMFASQKAIPGLSTGFVGLDAMTSGLHKGDLIILAGRPSMGKTSLAMNIAEHVAMQDLPVLVFSLETTKEALAARMLSSVGGVDQSKLRTGRLENMDWARISSAIQKLHKKNMFIDDSFGMTIAELKTKAKKLYRSHGSLSLIVIDYLQLMTSPAHKTNRNEEVGYISRQIKGLAKELQVPIICLSQLSRAVEGRVDKRPIASDIRDSGSVEQDADVIAFIYRDEVYDDNSPDKGIAEVGFVKQRNGPTGVVKVRFDGKLTKFNDL